MVVVTAGSVFSAAGQLVTSVLAVALPDWVVRYEFTRSELDLVTESGEMRVVYVDGTGESTFERTSLGRQGLREVCTLTFVFHRIVPRAEEVTAEVDDEVAAAAGALVDLMCVDNPTWSVPDGWDSIRFQPDSTTRTGAYLQAVDGLGRRLALTLSATAERC